MNNTLAIGILCLFLNLFQQLSATEYGLYFKSHEASGDQRTSLILDEGHPYSFGNVFRIAFQMRVRNGANYGSILHMGTDHEEYFHFMFARGCNNRNFPTLAFDESMFTLDAPIRENEWVDVVLQYDLSKNSLYWQYADKDTTLAAPFHGVNAMKVQFGKLISFTSDVAPMSIRDIKVSTDGELIRHWILRKHNQDICLDELQQAVARGVSPLWLIDNHIQWKRIYAEKSDRRIDVAFNAEKAQFYLVKPDRVETLDALTGNIHANAIRGGYPAMEYIDHLLYDTLTNRLFSYALNEGRASMMHPDEGVWSLKQQSTSEPHYYNHARIYNPADSCFYFFGGYGFYQYRHDLYRLKVTSGEIEKVEYSPALSPRYSAAIAIVGDELYIFGGRGNKQGKQEFTAFSYGELAAINLKTKSSRVLWRKETSTNLLMASSMYFEPEDSSFYAVSLAEGGVLWKVMKNDTVWTKTSKSIYNSQVWQDCDISFYAAPKADRLYLVMGKLLADQTHDISIYAINTPLLDDSEIEQSSPLEERSDGWLYTLLILIGLLLAGITLFLRHHRKKRQEETVTSHVTLPTENTATEEETESEGSIGITEEETIPHYFNRNQSSISLLGTFSVCNAQGEDITAQFTTRLKNMLILLILYTEKHEKGISVKKLTNILWEDKDEEAARNNRNVTLRKLRILLEKVGDMEIINDGNFIRINWGSNVFCDYHTVLKCIDEYKANPTNSKLLEQILEILLYGPLLSNTFRDWLDDFKESYSSLSIDLLQNQLKSQRGNNAIVLRITDILFLHDPLSEEALAARCASYYNQGKKGLAKNTYDRYCKEYKESLGEEYQVPLVKLYERVAIM